MANPFRTLPSTETNNEKWLERFLLLVVIGASALSMSSNIADPDLWGHVQYGRDVLQEGYIAATTTYSYTAEGYRWINHENLAEIFLAVVADWGGRHGLLFAKFTCSLFLILALMLHAFRQGAGTMAVAILTMIVAVNVSFYWSLRPQLLTYVYFTLMIVLLNHCFEGWRDRWHLPWFRQRLGNEAGDRDEELVVHSMRLRLLWLMPLLFFFWANSHGGFVAGYCIFSAYMIGRGVEAYFRRGPRCWGLMRRFALMIVVTGLATLVNPYSSDLHLWLIRSLSQPRPEIQEWASTQWLSAEGMKTILLIAVFSLSLLFSRRPRDFTHLMLLAITLWQSLEHHRHIPFFAILFGFWMPQHVEAIIMRLQGNHDSKESMMKLSKWAFRVTIAGLIFACSVIGVRLAGRLSELEVQNDVYPVSAVKFMHAQDLNGKLVVTYNWAQYAIAAFGRNTYNGKATSVGFDGRFRTCYPQEVVDMHFDFVIGDIGDGKRYRSPASPPPNGSRVLEFRQPDLVLISRRQKNSVHMMEKNAEQWVLLYQDALAQLWGRRTKYDSPSSPDYLRVADRVIGDLPQIGVTPWPAIPSANQNLSSRSRIAYRGQTSKGN